MSDQAINVHRKGFVRLADRMGGDESICRAARTSYGKGTRSISDDRSLIRFLVRHEHSTPLEFVQVVLHMRLPVFVARQLMRHRAGTFTECSARYSEVPDTFFVPDEVRAQSTANRQGSEGLVDSCEGSAFREAAGRICDAAHSVYTSALEAGVAREQARIVLPVSMMTDLYWSVNLRNLLHFLRLRCDSHAQAEMRDYANAIYEITRPIAPLAFEAFDDYVRDAVTLTRPEVESLRSGQPIATNNKREASEWEAKKKLLGL